MKIGIIVASDKERKPFFEVFGSPDMYHVGLNAYEVSMWRINSEKFIYLILSGIGEIAHYGFDATPSTNYRVGEYPKLGLYHSPYLDAVPDSAVQDLPKFICASADIVVDSGEPKRRLYREYRANICEMEAAGIVLTCNRNKIPCTMIKAVSDGVNDDIEVFNRYVYNASKACVVLVANLIKTAL